LISDFEFINCDSPGITERISLIKNSHLNYWGIIKCNYQMKILFFWGA
jgi:hypothetical protein